MTPATQKSDRVIRARAADAIPDAELVARILSGDVWAERALYQRHAGAVSGLAVRLLSNRADAEDVLQDTFLTALTKLSTLRDPSTLRAWLMRITVFNAHRRYRRRRLFRKLGLDRSESEVGLVELASPGASPEVRAELAWVDRALQQLPTQERMAWILRHVEGAQLEEVASLCQCSLATAKRRITAAEQRMKEARRE